LAQKSDFDVKYMLLENYCSLKIWQHCLNVTLTKGQVTFLLQKH